MAKGGRVVEAEFVFPYLAHAPMEPLNGFIKWDGETASARFGSQFPTPDHAVIAQVLGIGIDKVRLQTILAGGSFGRRAQQTTHVALELAQVAKAIGPGHAVKWSGPARTTCAAAIIARSAFIACAAWSATARSKPGAIPSSGSRS